MAKATKATCTCEQDVTLTLTREEAETLAITAARVGGSPDTTRREHFDSISRALRRAGIPRYSDLDGYSEISGHLSFSDIGSYNPQHPANYR